MAHLEGCRRGLLGERPRDFLGAACRWRRRARAGFAWAVSTGSRKLPAQTRQTGRRPALPEDVRIMRLRRSREPSEPPTPRPLASSRLASSCTCCCHGPAPPSAQLHENSGERAPSTPAWRWAEPGRASLRPFKPCRGGRRRRTRPPRHIARLSGWCCWCCRRVHGGLDGRSPETALRQGASPPDEPQRAAAAAGVRQR